MQQRDIYIIITTIVVILAAFMLMASDGEVTGRANTSVVITPSAACVVVGSQVDVLRAHVGLGRNRATQLFLENDGQYNVVGTKQSDWQTLPFYLIEVGAEEYWVGVTDVFTQGDCDTLPIIAAPPIVPNIQAFVEDDTQNQMGAICENIIIDEPTIDDDALILTWSSEVDYDYYMVDIFADDRLLLTIPVDEPILTVPAQQIPEATQLSFLISAYSGQEYLCATPYQAQNIVETAGN